VREKGGERGKRRGERETRRERSELRAKRLDQNPNQKNPHKNKKTQGLSVPHNPHNRNLSHPNAMKIISHLLRLSGSLYCDVLIFFIRIVCF